MKTDEQRRGMRRLRPVSALRGVQHGTVQSTTACLEYAWCMHGEPVVLQMGRSSAAAPKRGGHNEGTHASRRKDSVAVTPKYP